MKQSSYGQARLLLHDNLMNDTMVNHTQKPRHSHKSFVRTG
jgi:hypothetical protein